MKLEWIPDGETRQLDGPWYGVRVLWADTNAAMLVDNLALPVPTILPAYPNEIGRVKATGPIWFALGEEEGEDLAKANASPAPPAFRPADPKFQTDIWDWVGVGNPAYQAPGYGFLHWFQRPAWARNAAVTAIGKGPGTIVLLNCNNYNLNGARKWGAASSTDIQVMPTATLLTSLSGLNYQAVSLDSPSWGLPDWLGVYGSAANIIGNCAYADGPNFVRFQCRWSN